MGREGAAREQEEREKKLWKTRLGGLGGGGNHLRQKLSQQPKRRDRPQGGPNQHPNVLSNKRTACRALSSATTPKINEKKV